MASFAVGPVVAGEDDEGVVIDLVVFEESEDITDLVVEVFDHRGEAGDGVDDVGDSFFSGAIVDAVFAHDVIELGIDFAPLIVEFLGSVHCGVGDGGGDVAEERLVRFGASLDELHGIIHDDVVDVFSFFEGDFLSVVDVGGGVVGVGDGLALPAAKFVEAVGEWVGFAWFIGVAEAPFPEGSGGVSGVFEDLGEDDFFGFEEALGFANVATNGDFAWVLAGQEDGTGWAADGIAGVVGRELDALATKAVDVGSFKFLLAIDGKVSEAEVIGEDVDDVGLLFREEGGGEQEGQEELFHGVRNHRRRSG